MIKHGPWIAEYAEYLENFDPTPDYLYDGYKIPLDYVDWWEKEQPDWIGVMENAATLFTNLHP